MSISRCLFCNKIVSDKSGMKVLGHAICPACEQKLLTMEVGSPQYIHHLQRIKKIWSNL